MTELEQSTVEVDGVHFAVLSAGGEGPLALCLHGFPDSAQTWRHLMPELAAAGYRAVSPWMRGYLPTAVPSDGDYSIGRLAADANAFHDVLGGDSDAVLIGHDWGAMTAYEAASSAPDRWRRVVAMAVPPPPVAGAAFTNYEQLKRSFYVMLFQTPLAEYVVGLDDLAFIDGLWRDWSPGYDGSADLAFVKASLRDPANLAAAIGYYRAMFAGVVPDRSPTQPTLYLHGDADGAFLVAGTAGSAEAMSAESRFEIIPGVGHFLHLEEPAVINGLILEWIGG